MSKCDLSELNTRIQTARFGLKSLNYFLISYVTKLSIILSLNS